MTEEIDQNTINQLATLAQQSEMVDGLDWSILKVPKEEIFKAMAARVLEQLSAVEENQRAVVAMATMTKLLVENIIFSGMIKNGKN